MYFVTVDLDDRNNIRLGEIEKGIMKLNEIGEMIDEKIREIPLFYEGILIDEYVIMPNHVHLIIIINNVGADSHIRPAGKAEEISGQGRKWDSARTQLSLGEVIQRFKIMTTNQYIARIKSNNWPRFNKRLWQRDYWERIIRDEGEYNRIVEYIRNNPR